MGIPLPKGDIQALVFSLQDGHIPHPPRVSVSGPEGSNYQKIYVYKVLDSGQTPSV